MRASMLAAIVFAGCCFPAEAAQRAFVASYGSDANSASGCFLGNPCRTFTAALSAVDAGGEILALDAAGFGAVTINKSVSIIGNPGFYAGIAASTGNAVTIATASITVTLRGLSINSIGATNGIVMTNGSRLSIENCVVSNFSAGDGILVNTAARVRIVDSIVRDNSRGIVMRGGADAAIANTKVLGNSVAGVMVNSGLASTITQAAVSDSVISGNDRNVYAFETIASALSRIGVARSTISNGTTYGVVSEFAGGPTVVEVEGSLVILNGTGFAVLGGGGATLETFGNNAVRMNGPDTGTISTVPLR
jgi:hypothetical protein